MRVAVIGSGGQLGTDLVNAFGKETISLTHEDIEVSLMEKVQVLKNVKSDIIINTAAFHKTDACEDFPEKTFLVNSIGAKNIADISNKLNNINVYISTDYVFDGNKKEPYVENDVPNPINTYGLSKYVGELYTKNNSDKYYVIRVASLFGVAGTSGKGGNFIETMIKKANNNEKIRVVDDMLMSPTYTKDAAEIIKQIIDKKLPYGVYHVTNDGACSWFEFARTIFELLELKADINPIKTDEISFKANRPKNSYLQSEILGSHGIKIRNWKEALDDYLKEKDYI